MMKTLRRFAMVYERAGVGKVAAYYQEDFNAAACPAALPASDPTLGGWACESAGGIAKAFSECYRLTRDTKDLELAAALENRLCHGEAPMVMMDAFVPMAPSVAIRKKLPEAGTCTGTHFACRILSWWANNC